MPPAREHTVPDLAETLTDKELFHPSAFEKFDGTQFILSFSI